MAGQIVGEDPLRAARAEQVEGEIDARTEPAVTMLWSELLANGPRHSVGHHDQGQRVESPVREDGRLVHPVPRAVLSPARPVILPGGVAEGSSSFEALLPERRWGEGLDSRGRRVPERPRPVQRDESGRRSQIRKLEALGGEPNTA